MKAIHVALLAAVGYGAYKFWQKPAAQEAPGQWPRVLTAPQALKVDALLAKYFVVEETEVPGSSGTNKPVIVKAKLGPAAGTSMAQRVALGLGQGLSVYAPHDLVEAARTGKEPAEVSVVLANISEHPEVVREAETQNWHLYRVSPTTGLVDVARQLAQGATVTP